MHNLIDFIVRYKYWFVFLLLEGLSLVMLFRYNGYQGSVYFTTANEVIGSVYSFTSSIESYLSLQEHNRQLEADNESLRKELHDLKLKIKAGKMMPGQLSIRDSVYTGYKFVGAQVVNATLHKSNNLMTLDKGTADGIRPEMGVVCSQGAVGVVYMCSRHYSIVVPLLNGTSKVSCRLKGTEYFGTLEWERGNTEVSYMSGVPRHAKVKKGEIVETNGFSDIFPEGIPIGRVVTVGNSTDGMSYRMAVKLFPDFKVLRNVSVITNYSQPERIQLEQVADSQMIDMDELTTGGLIN